MKTIIILLLSLVTVFANAQSQILPLERKEERQQNVYYKDLNNDFVPYIGTWSGQVNGQTFKVTFEKVKVYRDFQNYWQDKLLAHYELKDARGNVVYSNYNEDINNSNFRSVSFSSIRKRGVLIFTFLQQCYNATVDIKIVDQNKTAMEWKYSFVPETILSTVQCDKFSQIPQANFVLTKQ